MAPNDEMGSVAAVAVEVRTAPETPRSTPVESSDSSRGLRRWMRARRFLRTSLSSSEERLWPRYPLQFKLAAAFAFSSALGWVLNFFLVVLPMAKQVAVSGRCKYSDEQLQHNAVMLFVYFVGATLTRVATFVPSVAARIAAVQNDERQGALFMYFIHMVLHGPQYIFCIGSFLFWAQLLQSASCDHQGHLEFYQVFRLYATYSCFISFSGLVFAYWQGRLICEAARMQRITRRRAPPGTIDKLKTCLYDPAVFGNEDGKKFPSECPICLCDWDPEDVIKITVCGHAYHQECLASWLKMERTCALCRRDVANCPREAPEVIVQGVPLEDLPSGHQPHGDAPEMQPDGARNSFAATLESNRGTAPTGEEQPLAAQTIGEPEATVAEDMPRVQQITI